MESRVPLLPSLGPKPDQDGCHGTKSEPPNDTPHYDFVNYSVTDLEPSSADLTTPPSTPCSSFSDDFPPNATGTASIQDTTTAASLRAILICEAVQQGHRDVSSGNLSIGGLSRGDGSRGVWTALTRDVSSSDPPSTITSTARNDIISNSREPIAEPRGPECPPSRKQSVHEPGPPAVTPDDDDQCTVEGLLERKVVSRGKGRRKRMVTQYLVTWQGWKGLTNL